MSLFNSPQIMIYLPEPPMCPFPCILWVSAVVFDFRAKRERWEKPNVNNNSNNNSSLECVLGLEREREHCCCNCVCCNSSSRFKNRMSVAGALGQWVGIMEPRLPDVVARHGKQEGGACCQSPSCRAVWSVISPATGIDRHREKARERLSTRTESSGLAVTCS